MSGRYPPRRLALVVLGCVRARRRRRDAAHRRPRLGRLLHARQRRGDRDRDVVPAGQRADQPALPGRGGPAQGVPGRGHGDPGRRRRLDRLVPDRACSTPRTGSRGGSRCSPPRSRSLAVGIAVYLGAHTGAGPAEAAALAWDPPVPFKWSYSLVQGGGALVGWLLGATIGVGTIAVIVVLGPAVDLTSRLLRLDVHQGTGAAARTPS